MSEENTPAPRQGLGVWIMSGSMALVMVIGGALAVNSGGKSVEEGNPTATRTVAPGGGHTIKADESEGSAHRSVTDETAGTDETGEAGVLGVQLTQVGLAGRDSGIRETVAPVLGARASAPDLTQTAQGQTAREDAGGATAKRGQPGAAPAAPQPDSPDIGVGAETPDHVEIVRSETGEELQVRFAVPTAPGSYALPMSVDGTQFVVHVLVGEDGRVTVPSFDCASTPYHHDPVSGRLTVTVVPADSEYADPAFAADARIDPKAMKPHAVSVPPADRHRSADVLKPAELADHVELEEDVQRDQGVDQEQVGAIASLARPATVRRSSPPAASTATEASTSLAHARAEVEPSEPELIQPDSVEPEETLGRPTSSEPGAPQAERAQVQPGPIAIRAVQSRQTEFQVGSIQTRTTLSKKPNPLVQARPSKAAPRSTVTATDPAESVSLSSTPIP